MMSGKRLNGDDLLVRRSTAGTLIDAWSGRVTIGSDVGYGIGRDGGLSAVVRSMPLQPGGGFVRDDFQIANVESVRLGVAGRGVDEAGVRGSLRGD